jgi:phosphatidylglycerophosphatase C
MGRTIAAFDFDGTLTRRDTVLPFLVRVCGRAKVARAVARVAPSAGRARFSRAVGELHHRDVTKAAILRDLLAGQDAARLARHGEAYAETLSGLLRPAMVRQLQWHRDEGHEIVIVSASLAAYLEPFAASSGVGHVIGVELETGPDGMLTGALRGPNVRGPEKATRLRAWLDGDEPEAMWAYGNSSGDRELLEMATHPVWVGGSRAGRQFRPSPP